MNNQNKKSKTVAVRPATKVNINFTVTVQKVHWRTVTLCDERSQTFSFPHDHDLEKTVSWLKSSAAAGAFDEFGGEIGYYVGTYPEDAS